MGSAFEEGGKRDMTARYGQDLRIAPRGEDREAVADDRDDDAGDPQAEANADRGGERAVEDRKRAGRAGEHDRLGKGAMHRHREAGEILVHHATSAPPPKLKKFRKKEDAANATDSPKTIWISRRMPP